MADSFVNIPSGAGGVQIVASAANLPLVGNVQGDLAVTADTGNLYEWNGTMWVLIASPSGVGPSFGVIQVPSGTNPVAHVATDTLTFTSSDSNITITGNSSTDTVNFTFTKVPGAANGLATLDGTGKVPLSEIPASLIGAVTYQGTWNANTNTPTLTSSTGTKGFYYLVSVAGNTNLDGHTGWIVGDWAVFDGNVWEQLQGGGAYITSLTGDVTGTGPGATATTIASIQGTTVSGTTGTGNVVFNTSPTIASPTLTGTATIASANFSGTVTFTNPPTISSFTQGSVIFAGASGLLSQDNSKFFWNDTNDQLLLSNGTATNPSYSFSSGTNYGMYFSAGQLDFTTAGIQALFIDSSQNTNIPFASKIHFVNTGGLATLYDWGTSTEGGSVSVNTTGGLSSTYTINIKDPGAGGAGQADFYNINLNSNNILQLARNDAGTDTYLLLAAELLFSTDNTQDLGGDSNGTFLYRPRHVFVGTDIGIGTSGLNNAAVQLQMVSTTKGFLQPVMTTTQKNAISSPPEGLEVYDATLHLPYFWNGSAWTTFGSGTVTSVSVVSANGLAGTVANATTTPAITLSTTITGILQGNGTAISAASTTGSGNIVLSASPTLTGTITAAAANFSGAITASNFSGSSSGTNTGDVTLAAFGSTPNANGLSIAGQVLNMQPADNTHPGGVSILAQTFAGNKTFSGTVNISTLTASELTGTDASKNLVSSNLTGDVTTAAFVATIANNAVTNAKLATMAPHTVKANATAGTAVPTDVTLSSPLGFNGSGQIQGPFTSFYFLPGGTATNTTGGNVYTNFATLYADFAKIKGGHIYFDDSLAACTMPAGTYDFTGAVFHGIFGPSGANPLLNLANGVIWTALPTTITDNLIVNSQSAAPIYTSPGTGVQFQNVLIVSLGAHLSCNGGSPMFKIGGSGGTGDNIIFLLEAIANIDSGSSGNEVIWMVNGGTALLYAGLVATYEPAILKDDGTGFAIYLIAVGSASFSTIQPNFSGFLIVKLDDAALYHYYNNSVSGLTATNVQDAIDEIAAGASENRLAKYDSAANSGTGETNLTSKAMPAGDLLAVYDGYFIRAGGAFAATTSLKRVRMYYGATVIADTGSVILNNGRWHIEARVYSDGTGTGEKAFSWGVTTLAALANFGSSSLPAEILGNSITIKCTGQGTASSDVTQDFMDFTLIKGLT